MRHQARLSTAVPHSTAFLPPAFIATLPPMHDASAEVGSTANTRPGALGGVGDAARDHAGFAEDRRRPRSATPGSDVVSTAPSASSFSVLMTAESGVSGIAPPV